MNSSPVRCPCLSGDTLDGCCGRYIGGQTGAPTAERLMRSRFTAFATGNPRYLLDTWHVTTRPRELQLDEDVHWYRLDILDRVRGGLLDANGIVEFEAWFRHEGTRGSQHERSRFVRDSGKWWYLDAE